ncbi:MAG: MarR family winged helix-turn-helix transcriptional regulator [Polyangiales bacterium]
MLNQVHREITQLVTQMRRLCSLTVNKRLHVVGCTLHEYAVLSRLAHESEVAQGELAFDAALDPAAVSRLVRDMTESGLVTTRVSPQDRRQRYVKITNKGRALERTLSPVVDDALKPLLSGLSQPEERQFLDLLKRAHEHAVAAQAELDSSEPPPPRTRKRRSA